MRTVLFATALLGLGCGMPVRCARAEPAVETVVKSAKPKQDPPRRDLPRVAHPPAARPAEPPHAPTAGDTRDVPASPSQRQPIRDRNISIPPIPREILLPGREKHSPPPFVLPVRLPVATRPVVSPPRRSRRVLEPVTPRSRAPHCEPRPFAPVPPVCLPRPPLWCGTSGSFVPGIVADFPELAQWGSVITIDGIEFWKPDLREVDAQLPTEWEPYSNGYLHDEPPDQLVWVSNDPWGFITEHYGYWRHHQRYGFVWQPLLPITWRPFAATILRDGNGALLEWCLFSSEAWSLGQYVDGSGFDDYCWEPFWEADRDVGSAIAP